MIETQPDPPSVLLVAGTSTGAGTSVALVEACRTLAAQLSQGRVGRVVVHMPHGADRAVAVAEGLSVTCTSRLRAIASELVLRSDTDIYIGFADRLPVTPKGKQFRVMVVQNPHLYEASDAPSLGTAGRAVLTRWARWSATKADLVVCATEASREVVLQAVPGLHPERTTVRPIRPFTPRPRTEVSDTIQTVMLLGDLYAYKRFDVAVEAITEWHQARIGEESSQALRVVHCGSQRDEHAATDFQAAVSRARAAGITVDERGSVSHDDAMEALVEADVLVSASEVETQGLTILEALAVGVPVVARAIGPVLDVAGTACQTFPVAGGVQDIAAALTGIQDVASRRELVHRGLGRVQISAGWNLLPDP